MAEKSIETEGTPPAVRSDGSYIDWNNIDVEGFVVPDDKAERRRLMRAIRDELTDRLKRKEEYVVAVYFKGQQIAAPEPGYVETDKLMGLMKRFPTVRSLKR